MTDKDFSAVQADLHNAVKALMVLRSEIVRLEADMAGSVSKQVQVLRQEAADFRQDVGALVGHAGSAIGKEAEASFSTVTGEYRKAVTDLTVQASKVNRMIWSWFAVTAAVLFLAVFSCWLLLMHYRKELAATWEALQRYEGAMEVVRAFHASDALVCDGRICIQPDAQMAGNRLYRQAKPRAASATQK